MTRRLPTPSIQCVCPSCEEEFVCLLGEDARALSCPHCDLVFEGSAVEGSVAEKNVARRLDRCTVCGNTEFYIQKDFNRQLGLMIVLTSFLIIFLIMLLWDHLVGIYFLFGLAAVDWIVYRMLANVTVCYLCQSVYRGVAPNPEHTGFYLGSEEKFKHRRGEWLKTLLKRT